MRRERRPRPPRRDRSCAGTGTRPATRPGTATARAVAQHLEPRVLLASAELVTDINTTTVGSYPRHITPAGSAVAYFDAYTNAAGQELWKTNGTAAGTVLVKDINPGVADAFPDAYPEPLDPDFTPVGATTFFVADDGAHGAELWKTDGTTAGTVMVADVRPGRQSSEPRQLTALGNVLLFAADSGTGGSELWRSDGTAAGTVRVKDIDVRAGVGSDPDGLVVSGTRVYFAATTEKEGRELWSTDGTFAGTTLVKDLRAGDASSSPANLFDAAGTLYFAAAGDGVGDPANGPTLWKTTGTAAATTQVSPLVVDPAVPMARIGSTIYFTSAQPDSELYKTNGTPAGTTRVADLYPGPNGSKPRHLTPFGQNLYFTAEGYNAAGQYVNYELFKTDGTAAGTTLVKDIDAGQQGSEPYGLTVAGNKLFFGTHERYSSIAELWATDGTAAGTVPMRSPVEGAPASNPRYMVALGTKLLYAGADAPTGVELWVSTGTPAGTALVKDINTGTDGAFIRNQAVFNGKVYFAADDGYHGQELWSTDGTAAGTKMLVDLSPLAGFSDGPAALTVFNGRLYFAANSGQNYNHQELWSTDGTAAGTRQVKDISADGLSITQMAVMGGSLYFLSRSRVGQPMLWKSDGTTAGTTLVAHLSPPPTPHSWGSTGLMAHGGALYFFTYEEQNGDTFRSMLWRSDGTAEGTVPLHEFGQYMSYATLTPLGDQLFFAAYDVGSSTGKELWVTDGTPEGTHIVKDVNPGPRSAQAGDVTAWRGRIWFTAFVSDTGLGGGTFGLFSTDGTPEGTVRVDDPARRIGPQLLFLYNDALYFRGRNLDDNQTDQLFRSDGTNAGTVPVTFAGPQQQSLSPYGFAEVNDMLTFVGMVDGHSRLFVSDGTTAGTSQVTGSYEDTYGDTPLSLGGRVLFIAAAPATSEEWYRTTIVDAAAPRATSGEFVAGFGGATDAMAVHFTDDVSGSLAATDLALIDQATGMVLDGAVALAQFDAATQTATFTVSTTRFPGGRLPAGRYRAVMAARSVADAAGNVMAQPFQFEFTVAGPPAAVTGRWVFYNRSSYDGNDPAANAADDGAIAADKAALLPAAAATFANATSYARGINGVMVDVLGLPPAAGAAGEPLSASDFVFRTGTGADASGWSDAPAPSSVAVRRGAGAGSSDRVTLVWPDGAIRNMWLKVTVKANEHTGLVAPDVFYFGNLVGETGDGAAAARVSALDLAAVKRQLNTASTLIGRTDFNRDGRINSLDLSAARAGVFRELELFTAPVG